MNISFFQTRQNIRQSIPQYSSKLMYSNKRVSSLSKKNDYKRKSKDSGGILFHALYRWLHHLPFKMAAEPLEQPQSIHAKVSAVLWDVSSGKPAWNSIDLIGKMFNPFAPGDFAQKRVLRLVEWFSGHCRAIKS